MEQRYSISFYGQVIFPGGLTYSMYIISMREIPTESHSAGGNVRFMYTRRYLSLTFVKCSRREMSRFSFLQNVRAGQACCENVLSLSPSPEIERRLYDRFFDNDKARDRRSRNDPREEWIFAQFEKKKSWKSDLKDVGGAGATRLAGAAASVHCAVRGDQWKTSCRASARSAYGDVAVAYGRLRARNAQKMCQDFC